MHQCVLGADWHIVCKPEMCLYGEEGFSGICAASREISPSGWVGHMILPSVQHWWGHTLCPVLDCALWTSEPFLLWRGLSTTREAQEACGISILEDIQKLSRYDPGTLAIGDCPGANHLNPITSRSLFRSQFLYESMN